MHRNICAASVVIFCMVMRVHAMTEEQQQQANDQLAHALYCCDDEMAFPKVLVALAEGGNPTARFRDLSEDVQNAVPDSILFQAYRLKNINYGIEDHPGRIKFADMKTDPDLYEMAKKEMLRDLRVRNPPLAHLGIMTGNLSLVKLLYEHHIDEKDDARNNALHRACKSNFHDNRAIVEFLYKNRKRIFGEEDRIELRVNLDAEMPLHIASVHGQDGIVKFLLTLPTIDVIFRAWKGSLPLHKACEEGAAGSLEVVKALCEEDSSKKVYAEKAAEQSNDKWLRDWQIFEFDVHGDMPIHLAAKNGYLELVQYFIEECGVDPNTYAQQRIFEGHQMTPLHLAVKERQTHVMEYLLNNSKIDVNKKNFDGHSAIFYCDHQHLLEPKELQEREEAAIWLLCKKTNSSGMKRDMWVYYSVLEARGYQVSAFPSILARHVYAHEVFYLCKNLAVFTKIKLIDEHIYEYIMFNVLKDLAEKLEHKAPKTQNGNEPKKLFLSDILCTKVWQKVKVLLREAGRISAA